MFLQQTLQKRPHLFLSIASLRLPTSPQWHPPVRRIHPEPEAQLHNRARSPRNCSEALEDLLPEDGRARALSVRLPKAAVEKDARSLFEDAGYTVTGVIAIYNSIDGRAFSGWYTILLESEESALQAYRDFKDTRMFGRPVKMAPVEQWMRSDVLVNLRIGWHAITEASIHAAKIRTPYDNRHPIYSVH
ncbi:hypothetical protein BDV96DRAFT_407377 [Lophiotrema nucula]|uniref:RRM domain-containing protein n=1 Tax=Lophiotrema nucula TaxID=690887 RepID=A0A6A5ZGW2_9PLEO|nr:hypothetical protein BDV96DRAFT_407377 [Lophiotrema nucula]